MLDLVIEQVGRVGKFQCRMLLAALWACAIVGLCSSVCAVDFLDSNWNADNTDIDTCFFTLHAPLFTEEES